MAYDIIEPMHRRLTCEFEEFVSCVWTAPKCARGPCGAGAIVAQIDQLRFDSLESNSTPPFLCLSSRHSDVAFSSAIRYAASDL